MRVSTIARLQMSKGEIRDIGDGFEEPCLFYAKGINLCGDKYMVCRAASAVAMPDGLCEA
jgi:hypothetical protein